MGLSTSKSKSTSTSTVAPSNYNQPYVDAAATNLAPGFAAAQTNNASLMPRLNSALDYSGNVLNGNYLNGNPALQGVIDNSNRDITTGVDSQFEGAGRYGSGDHAGVLARALANNENQIRYQNYATERGYQNAAPGQIGALTAVSSALPQAAGSTYADQVRALLGQYNTQTGSGTQTTDQGVGSVLGSVIGSGLAGWASGGFKGI